MRLVTDRLVVRDPEPTDLGPLLAIWDDPRVAAFQGWQPPFPRDVAHGAVRPSGPPEDGDWRILTICLADEPIGNVALQRRVGGKTVEVGYNLDPSQWGNGYATETVRAVVRELFGDDRTVRIEAKVDPDNVASARVVEQAGFVFEGRTRSSFWTGTDVADDLVYGLTRTDHEAWSARPRHRPREVRLTPVTLDNERDVYRLATHKTQEAFVSPMAESFADALFPEVIDGAPVVPRMWAVEADDVIAGFLMIAAVTDAHSEPYLWRLLIDRLHQRRGIGSMAMDLLERMLADEGASALLTSWEEGPGSPRPFYLGRGFVPTGRIVDGETEARVDLGGT